MKNDRFRGRSFFFLLLLFFVGIGVVDDVVLNQTVNFILGFAEHLFPLHGVHSAQQRLAVDREVFPVGQGDFSGILTCHLDKVVDIAHGVESDSVSHFFSSFLAGIPTVQFRFAIPDFVFFFVENSFRSSGARIFGALHTIIFTCRTSLFAVTFC